MTRKLQTLRIGAFSYDGARHFLDPRVGAECFHYGDCEACFSAFFATRALPAAVRGP